MSYPEKREITLEEREICLHVLQNIAEDPAVINDDERMKGLIARIHREGRKGQRRADQQKRDAADRAVLRDTAMVRRDYGGHPLAGEALLTLEGKASSPPSESVGTLHRALRCYICKQRFADVHFFYHLLCPPCAVLNYSKRQQRADLRGRTAVVTGGRIKIGYQTALRLLRDGARVIVTTRFPADAARRFGAEGDFPEWQGRLTIYALDLRNLPAVEAFADYLVRTEPHVDIVINNAAQTVKRPLAFYRHLLEGEGAPPAAGLLTSSRKDGSLVSTMVPSISPESVSPVLLEVMAQYPAPYAGVLPDGALRAYFPPGEMDPDGQQVDRRPDTSWSLRLHEVGTLELLETHLVNAVAPFILCRNLKPLLLRSPHDRRFIVNVSAMEGQFGRNTKTALHPHTNMAKAALNMLTRTCAADFAEDGIFMNSVDTGWITDEKPHDRREQYQERVGFHTPLDVVDGMARLYDPVARGVSERDEPPLHGHFLKDYHAYPW